MMRSLSNGLGPASLTGIFLAVGGFSSLPAGADTSLVIREFVLAHEIENREPVGNTDFYRAGDGRAVAFARIWNGGQPTAISFRWRYGETVHADVPVSVGVSPGWRTWSTVDLRPGTWRVALVDADGAVLAEREFNVVPGPDPAAPMATSTVPDEDSSSISFQRAEDPFSSETPTSADDLTR
jgi:hypothetical protein